MITHLDTLPSLDDLAEIAEAAFSDLPAEVRETVEGVAIRVDDWPDDSTLRAMRIGNPLNLLGLYSGVHIGRKTTGAIFQNVDMIFLYRRPILEHWRRTGEPLRDIVAHVLVHEIGHHFGLSDRDMHEIEARPDE